MTVSPNFTGDSTQPGAGTLVWNSPATDTISGQLQVTGSGALCEWELEVEQVNDADPKVHELDLPPDQQLGFLSHSSHTWSFPVGVQSAASPLVGDPPRLRITARGYSDSVVEATCTLEGYNTEVCVTPSSDTSTGYGWSPAPSLATVYRWLGEVDGYNPAAPGQVIWEPNQWTSGGAPDTRAIRERATGTNTDECYTHGQAVGSNLCREFETVFDGEWTMFPSNSTFANMYGFDGAIRAGSPPDGSPSFDFTGWDEDCVAEYHRAMDQLGLQGEWCLAEVNQRMEINCRPDRLADPPWWVRYETHNVAIGIRAPDRDNNIPGWVYANRDGIMYFKQYP